MYTSFYTAARGAMEQQRKMDVVANNLANANNNGFKSKNAKFRDLMYYNLNNYTGAQTPMKAGTGIVVETTDTDFTPAAFITSNGEYDYAIETEGFFMLQNPQNGEITYTRNGHFSLSLRGTTFYLINDNGNFVLDQNRRPITVNNGVMSGTVSAYGFNILDGMLNVGNNEFQPVEKNGQPYLLQAAKVRDHALEMSGTDVAEEFTHMIETQRAYSYVLRMVTTSDEVISTINSLRQ